MDLKKHWQDHKTAYLCGATAVVTAGITVLIMRNVGLQRISPSATGTAGRDVIVTRVSGVMNNVSFISSNRKGAPSWVVRCIETGLVFTSQRAAALAMEITESNISRHLNGLQDNAQGYTFERICMAA